ncbi:transcriptional regulator, TetR family [Paenibacillus sp. UNCCL117]|uniref:TetR/AcrR family transcriptional regulator n=1 Tax=unclassified Paenibacillus TaxID=185978 RepID=UPI0008815F7A|nr:MULTISPECIES: TetR/AcrR family transcriptional regulator [unclassified Paenibacillus]SDC44240.1 DNA-binding transcriptional regulator, AcrR family [Paenibacillus sp. cl123]SFW12782.1 transcriptional regulator, TetR family [Paenibacillus sp. UNCCL117]
MESIYRVRILQAARGLFNTRGYRSVTVQDLAEKLGISKKTIYQHFAGKEDIAHVVVEETIQRVDHVIGVSRQTESNPILAIKEILKHVKDDSTRFGPLFLMDIEKYLPALASRHNDLRARTKQSLRELLQSAQERGLARKMPVPLTAEVLSVCMKAIVLSENRFVADEAVDLFLDIFCNGIASSAAEEA